MNRRILLASAISALGLLALGTQAAHAQYRAGGTYQGQGAYVPQQQYQNQGYANQNQGYSDQGYTNQGYAAEQTPAYENQFRGYTSQYSQGGSSSGQGTGVLTDRMIANWLGAISKMQIDLSESVQGQSAFRSINKYARDEIQNHRELLRELARFTPNPGAGIGEQEENQNYSQSSYRGRENEGSGSFTSRSGAQQASYQQSESQGQRTVNFPQLRREICNEILRSLEHELAHQQGMDFDWTFVGQQCVLHDQWVAEMKVLRRYASPQLRDVIDDALDEAKSDERKLTQIMDQLKDAENREHGQHSSQGSSGSRSSQNRNEG